MYVFMLDGPLLGKVRRFDAHRIALEEPAVESE
jgi:hypothetical protein